MQMTRENKLALVVGFGLILLVGVLISDHFSTARNQQSADLAANRPIDPLSQVRRSDPELIDLQVRRERPTDSMRSPLAMNTTEITPEQPAAQPAPIEQPQNNGVQRVVMGQPVNGNGHAASNNPSTSNQTSAPNVPFLFHDVQPGETLTSIAIRYYRDATLVNDLAAFNDLSDPNSLRVNHRLRIPASEHLGRRAAPSTPTTTQTPTTQPTRQAPTTAYTTYTVKSGDTLSELSLQLLGTSRRWRELYEHNRDVIRDPDNLLAGTVLKVPKP